MKPLSREMMIDIVRKAMASTDKKPVSIFTGMILGPKFFKLLKKCGVKLHKEQRIGIESFTYDDSGVARTFFLMPATGEKGESYCGIWESAGDSLDECVFRGHIALSEATG